MAEYCTIGEETVKFSVESLYCRTKSNSRGSNKFQFKKRLPIFVADDFSLYGESHKFRLAVNAGFKNHNSRVVFLLESKSSNCKELFCVALIKFKHTVVKHHLAEHEIFYWSTPKEAFPNVKYLADEVPYEYLERISKSFFPIVNKFVAHAILLPNFQEGKLLSNENCYSGNGELNPFSNGDYNFTVAPSEKGMIIQYFAKRETACSPTHSITHTISVSSPLQAHRILKLLHLVV